MSWTFEKVVLVVMGALVLACLGFTAWQRSVADELERNLKRSETQMIEMGKTAQETFNLRAELERDGLSNSKPFAYIEKQMVESRIGKKFSIQPQSGIKGEGWKDENFNISPTLSDSDFTRQQIGTFLIYLEAKSSRMKITRIRLDRSTRRGAGADDWKPTVTVTDRSPVIEAE